MFANFILNRSFTQNLTKMTRRFFATKKNRLIKLQSEKISIEPSETQSNQEINSKNFDYLELKEKIKGLVWEQMPFDELCSLDKQYVDAIQTELKKEKFNISDEEFLKNNSHIPQSTYEDLNSYYRKVYSLLKNTNDFYEESRGDQGSIQKGYLNEMYVHDLKDDPQLNQIIGRFIKNIDRPKKLQSFTEPTFVKRLLGLKRELMLLGIHFETKAEKKESKNRKEGTVVKQTREDPLPQIKVLEVLNYEYEFWQDVYHNRAKNGGQDNFIVERKEIPNPNGTILIKEVYPTIKMTYIVNRIKSKERIRNFCVKADLLIEIDGKMKRKVKVQWEGPNNRKSPKTSSKPKPSVGEGQSSEHHQQPVQRKNYMVIDYENLFGGNPTIKPVFQF